MPPSSSLPMHNFMEADQYLSISSESEGIYKEKGSKFIALAMPVDSVDEVKIKLDVVRKRFHDARHHCYAYRIGLEQPEMRFNDDGEPSGTAGKPIYGQIESFGLTNILIVVVRYFGGVKLGTGGLIQAYKTASKDALEQATLVTKTLWERISIRFPYLAMNDVMKIVKDESLEILHQDFSMEGKLIIRVRKLRYETVSERFSDIPGVIFEPIT